MKCRCGSWPNIWLRCLSLFPVEVHENDLPGVKIDSIRRKAEAFMNKKMRIAQIGKPGGEWELAERELGEPGPRQVRVKVEACGICHSDMLVKEGWWPGIQYPRVPGHEIAGRVDAIGSGVIGWKPGQRVGVGWHGGHCFVCEQCRRGDFAMCVNRKITGIDF